MDGILVALVIVIPFVAAVIPIATFFLQRKKEHQSEGGKEALINSKLDTLTDYVKNLDAKLVNLDTKSTESYKLLENKLNDSIKALDVKVMHAMEDLDCKLTESMRDLRADIKEMKESNQEVVKRLIVAEMEIKYLKEGN